MKQLEERAGYHCCERWGCAVQGAGSWVGSLQGESCPCCPPAPEISLISCASPISAVGAGWVLCVCGKLGWLWVCAVAPGAF